MSHRADRSRGQATTKLSRRGFIHGAAAAILGVTGIGATAGCSSGLADGLVPSGSHPGTVNYWNLFGGGDGVRMRQMEDGYRKANPGVDLQAVTLAWGNPYYTKLSLATLGKRPPDVAVSHLTRMKTLVAAGLLEELTPDDLARHGMSADKFNARAWRTGLVNGRVYGIPMDTHPFTLFYNTKVCQEAGLLDSAGRLLPINSEQDFVDALAKAKKVTGKFGCVVSVNNDTATPWRLYQSLYAQLGGQMLANQGKTVVIDDAKAMKVLGLLKQLTDQRLIPQSIDYQGAIATFTNGDSGFFVEGEWEITTFQTAKMPFSMAPFPNVYGGADNYAVQADSHCLVLPRQPIRDQAEFDRSLAFVRSMLDQSQIWAAGGHIPAWLPFRDSAEYRGMHPQSYYASSADVAVYDPEAWYSGSGSDFELVVGSAIGAVVSGQLSPREGIAQMRSKLGTLASTAAPV